MGQKLYLIKNDKYRLELEGFDKEFERIKSGRSKYNYRFSFKEKLSEGALESYEANVVENKIGFDLKTQLNFGTYLYVIETFDLTKQCHEELAYGFIEVLPDVAAVPL